MVTTPDSITFDQVRLTLTLTLTPTLTLTLTFDQFITAWEKNGFELTEEDDSLKAKFTFVPHD